MNAQEMPSITTKLSVGEHAIYVKVGWRAGRPVYIDVKLSLIKGFQHSGSETELAIRAEHLHTANTAIELITVQASLLLENGIWDLGKLCESWRGTHVYYGGACPTLPRDELGGEQRATGALDAAARLIGLKVKDWKRKMMDEQQIENMIEECLKELNADETKFTAWEQTFLEGMEDSNDHSHLSEEQVAKLEEIYDEKCC